MFGELSIWAWMGIAIVFGIGGGTGFFISRQIKDKRTLELEEKLEAARNELATYQGDVNQHFLKTSLLLGKLTNNYREVYEHLATGAQKLCYEKPNMQKLELPENKILPEMDTAESNIPVIEQTDKNETTESISANENEKQQDIVNEEVNAEEITAATNDSVENANEKIAGKPLPEDIPDAADEEDVHLGAESAPSVDDKLHKTHPAIH